MNAIVGLYVMMFRSLGIEKTEEDGKPKMLIADVLILISRI